MSSDVQEEGNIKVRLSTDNRIILENSANAKLIVTQHSGAMHLGSYLNVPVMLIFKGQLPIKGLDDSVRFIQNLQRKDIYISLVKMTW
jgi:ADP-heptose:LPS heptosyltransferase